MGFRDRLGKFWMGFRNDPRAKPALADVKYKAGCQLLEAGDYANALVLFNEAIQHNPGRVEAHLGLGEAHRRLGAYDEARDAFRRVVRVDPQHAEAQFKLGQTYIVLKDYEMAKAKYDVLLRLDHPLANQLYQAIPCSAFSFEGDEHRQSAWGHGSSFSRSVVTRRSSTC